MLCPRCKSRGYVIDTRLWEKENVMRRRYECQKCDERFTTVEMVGVPNELLWLKASLKTTRKRLANILRLVAERIEEQKEIEIL